MKGAYWTFFQKLLNFLSEPGEGKNVKHNVKHSLLVRQFLNSTIEKLEDLTNGTYTLWILRYPKKNYLKSGERYLKLE